ncbi:MAG: hypothetical protein IKF14_16705 [Atopobiaceae bacterium]|nr:hypothetical protein [Atopobiaceae bacterium]
MIDSFYTIPGAPFLAHLSDLHNRDYRPVKKSLLRHKPELICVTGDIIYGTMPENDISPLVAQPNALGLLSACANIAPTFVSLAITNGCSTRKTWTPCVPRVPSCSITPGSSMLVS